MEKGEAKVRVEEEYEGLEGKETNLSLLVICSEDEVRESARNETSINVDAEELTDHDVRRLDQTKEEDLEVSFVGRVKGRERAEDGTYLDVSVHDTLGVAEIESLDESKKSR